MNNILINVVGKVQGVGFRYFCLNLALKYDLVGYAKNLDDGSVDILIQGNVDKIQVFLSQVSKGNRFIKVNSISTTENPIDSSLKKFNIVY
ncbi:acylphosphatase [uncultured Clostridium sp.]|uniref:acylphosphatase n=1 Tax=uncultured Clostridium sp. TaxID=59620 RepID=UPI002629CB30|nr:acylphosphatase [uncultured Clostridium sp.]